MKVIHYDGEVLQRCTPNPSTAIPSRGRRAGIPRGGINYRPCGIEADATFGVLITVSNRSYRGEKLYSLDEYLQRGKCVRFRASSRCQGREASILRLSSRRFGESYLAMNESMIPRYEKFLERVASL